MKSLVVRVAAVALAISTLPGAAHAEWVTGGSSLVPIQPTPSGQSGTADGLINYAVWKNDGTHSGDLFAQMGITSVSSLATAGGISNTGTYNTAQFAYIYQVVNTSYPSPDTPQDPDHKLDGLFVEIGNKTAGGVKGVALANGYVLTENDPTSMKVGPTSNQRLGINSTSDPLESGIVTGTATDSDAKTAITADWNKFPNEPTGPDAVKFTFTNFLFTDEYTTLMIITSDFVPGAARAATQDGGEGDGLVATPGGGGPLIGAPEPSTFGLIALAIPLMGFGYARRLRKNLPAQAATLA